MAVTPKTFGVALGYIFVSAYKTFRALCKVCDVEESWGQQGLVFSRMLFENYVTAKWLAACPSERSERFIEFGHIAEVQSALIKGQIDDGFFVQGAVPPSEFTEIHRQFFRVLPKFAKRNNKQRLTKDDVLRMRWTKTSVLSMVKNLNEPSLIEDYHLLCSSSNSVVHTTPFAARANIADNLTFRWTPDAELAAVAMGAGLEYLLRLALFCNERLHLCQEAALDALEQERRALSGIT